MKKLVCSLVIITLGVFASDRFGGEVMQFVNNNTHDVLAPKLKYVKDSIHEDVVIMGASRCHHHYIPNIIADTLGMTVYNAGVGGAENIYSHYIVLSHILERYTPKVICLEVMPTDYNHQDDPFSVISFFTPLFGKSERADSIYRLAGVYWRYKASHLYRYNAKASSNLWGLMLNRQKKNNNGYIPLPEPGQYPQKIINEERSTEIDQQKIEYLHRFVNLCRSNRIKLMFVISPKFTKVDVSHYNVLKTFAQENRIPFLDYHTMGLYLDHPEYFKDTGHLWDKGAKLYSSVFARDFKRVLNNEIYSISY